MLRARDIVVAYNRGTVAEQRALDGATIEVRRGELVVLVGVTGSGKSTLLRVLAGLIEPDSGAVTLDDGPLPRPAARAIGIVFQNPERQLFGETVLEDVSFGPQKIGHPGPRSAAEAALTRVGLDPVLFGSRSPFGLSGGEARKAAIAGILALEPAFLLLDEPTVGLDADGRRAVVEVVRREKRERGVVIVTHHPDPFLPLADRMVALRDGRVVFEGSLDDALHAPGAYEAAGLRLPDLLAIQAEAVARGARLDRVAVEPRDVADVLLRFRERD